MLHARPTVAVAGGCVLLAALSLLIPAAPSYDPWSWLVWGREVLQLDLRTETGPSWKPLPILFTAPYSLLGDVAPSLWLATARAFTFGAVVVAGAIGLRLAGRPGAVLAALPLLANPFVWTPTLLGASEGMLMFFVLLAVERHLAGREGQAFASGVAAGLLRPEAWPFLGLYALWLLYRDRRRLWWIAVGLAVLPVLWLLPELWGSGSLWRAAERAQATGPNSPARADRPAFAVLENFIRILPGVVIFGLALGVAATALRRVAADRLRDAAPLALLGGSWLLLVMVMTEAGFSGINRYLTMPVAILAVLGGIGSAWALSALLRMDARRPLALAAAALLVLLVAAGTYRTAKGWDGSYSFVARHDYVTSELDDAIARAGGERRLEECGRVYASFLMTPPVAWELEKHLEEVGAFPAEPGTILRTRLRRGDPLLPHPDWYAKRPERRFVARTEYWSVEQACVSG